MPLGKLSLQRLSTCHPDIRTFAIAVALGVDRGDCPGLTDITVLCGWRGEKEQNEAFAKKTSKLQWPRSKHNHVNDDGEPESLAVDMAPYPVDWSVKGLARFKLLRRFALQVADKLGIKIRIISWDWPHFELLAPPAAVALPRPAS